MPRKATTPKALSKPRSTCPFSGQPLQAVELSTGDWQVRGQGWVSAQLFQTEEQALYFFSHNEGKAPGYKTTQQRVQVKHDELAPDVKEDSVTEGINQAVATGKRMADEFTKEDTA